MYNEYEFFCFAVAEASRRAHENGMHYCIIPRCNTSLNGCTYVVSSVLHNEAIYVSLPDYWWRKA